MELDLKTYDIKARKPDKIAIADLRPDQLDRLVKSKRFCMLPWLHLHGWPTGTAFPCCVFGEVNAVGDMRKESLEDIWNNAAMRDIRQKMLNDEPVAGCTKCYQQEDYGMFSMRNSSNKTFGHHISDVDKTESSGYHPEFKIRYWDIRFSNICNFKCRYCGPHFSSSWYDDKAALHGKHSIGHDKIIHAGKDKENIWEQMQPHMPYIEQIYFAGGEPLIMEEHYKILKYLVDNDMTHVRLVYNTNFSELRFKKQDVLEWWKKFKSVSVGASLDAMATRAEYMRKGTIWPEIEDNRRRMLEICPNVDFYISATVNIFNVMHITDFHKDWVEKGLIKPSDFNINVLHTSAYYRCDVLPLEYKLKARDKIEEMIAWLSDKDSLSRATNGYKSLINFLMDKDNTKLLGIFFELTDQLDTLRKEKFDDVFTEYRGLRDYA